MEDEQGGVSLLPMSGKFDSEPLVENMGGENQVEESYEEGDEGEIMVEIVGSNVFVGGVSSEKGVFLGSEEVGDFEGHAWERRDETASRSFGEAMDVCNEGEGNKMGESEAELWKSKDECGYVVKEDVSFCERVDPENDAVRELSLREARVLDDGVWNPESETKVTEISLVVNSEENATEDETVDKDRALKHPVEAIVEGKVGTSNDCGVGDEFVAAESKDSILEMDSLVSNVQVENQGCLKEFYGTVDGKTFVGERGEVDVLNFKHGALDVILPDESCVNNDECSKNEPDLANDVVHQNHVFSTQQADGGYVGEVRNNKGLNNQRNMKTLMPNEVGVSVINHASIFETEDNFGKLNGFYATDSRISEKGLVSVREEREYERIYNGGMEVNGMELELGSEEPDSEANKFKLSNEETIKSGSSLGMHQSVYLSSPENEGHFSQSDLVWGKVRSHPWWPGQIFDPEDASEKAVKYCKKDSYLVAYFGDQTFAWNDASVLKPFRSYFPQIEKQNNSETFQNAVNCALEEVSRRVELGLACSCIPKNAYDRIQTQVVENTGICEESSRRYGVDHSSRASCFEPDKLLDYVRDLAPRASSGADRLDLVIARAQLSAFCRFKGYCLQTEFPSCGELLENDADTERMSGEVAASKRKHTPKDDSHSRKKRSLTDLMGPDAEDEGKSISSSSGRKRKPIDTLADRSDKRASIYAEKVSTSMSQTPKPLFKIGECIRKVASQLTGSTSLVKGNNDEMVIDGSPKINEQSEKRSEVVSAESFSVSEMLLQIQLLAQDPKKQNDFDNSIRTFFLSFRSAIALNRRGRKRKIKSKTGGGSGGGFEFDDVNDSYWTDRIIHNHSEEQPFGTEKSVKLVRKPHSRKRFSSGDGDHPTAATELDENIKRRKQESSSPAELILNFAERNCLPSEINLNKMFRRFGPLMESETEVDHDVGRAKVIFKRGSDAEVAHNSAEKFNIFGPVSVNYQIGYSPVISVKISPLAIPQCQEYETLMI